ncbi:anion transporter [Solibacillus kalamii]|uniref:Citrate:succinate antiporter n=1 Tax=Solibacillus kalamii TaxID=1748298 RepID=A0ABX3ZD41_9BACL|nr:SLC13 family permease [Solibacillus kalamii]MBM7667225.1 anion transporter [Solibacillus kalamii]OUZ37320.1 citrate:succinate antiporter [Solibacillus kalamii]
MTSRIERNKRKKNLLKTKIQSMPKKILIIIAIHIFFMITVMFIQNLDYSGKVALFAFLSAMTLWVTTKISAGWVAITLIMFIIVMNAAEPDLLYNSLSEKVVWLMIGAFIIGEAVKKSGLAERLTAYILNKSDKKENVVLGLSSVLFATAFFIPSTSGRAALSMPIMKQLSQKFSSKEKNILAIIAPVVILMSTSATLIGAGSHLIGIGFLESTGGESISYIQWLLWGAPFALVVTFLSLVVIKMMLWPRDSEEQIVSERSGETIILTEPFEKDEQKTLILILFLIIGWMTESLHGLDIELITIIGAIIFMIPNYGIITWKQGMNAVSWNLVMFVAAATALGKVLVDTGIVDWMENEMISFLHLFVGAPDWLIVLMILVVTVTSHLYITSHTTRAIVFIPGLILFSELIGVNPSTIVFLSLIGMNYCVTVPVSSKALLLFYEEGDISYDARNLVKLSTVLMPLYIFIIMLFYFTFWQWTGMHL